MSLFVPDWNHPAIAALGWSLLHFVWQGFAISGLLAAILLMLRRTSAAVRYFVACTAFAMMAACPLLTWCCLMSGASAVVVAADPVEQENSAGNQVRPIESASPPAGDIATSEPFKLPDTRELSLDPLATVAAVPMLPQISASQVEPPFSTVSTYFYQGTAPLLPWLVSGWLAGVIFQSLRLLVGWRFLQRMKQLATSPTVGELHARCQQLARQLGIRRSVTLVQSALIEVPAVFGWLRPIILLPAQALTGLDATQLNAILAHELAHIRRHDYLVNLIQTVLETLLFYHPAVWWVSRQIRDEREHCCDDIAVVVCGNRIVYARALAEMEQLRASPQLTLAANSGSLLGRIKRLIRPTGVPQRSVWWAASPIAMATVGVLLTGMYLAASANAELPDITPAVPEKAVPEKALPQEPGKPVEDAKATSNADPQVCTELKGAIDRARVSLLKTKTAHVKYRMTRFPSHFKPGMTPARCREILQKYDLLKQPDDLRRVVAEMYDDTTQFGDRPWSEAELFVDGAKVRESGVESDEGKIRTHITDETLSLQWSAGNAQINIEPIRDSHLAQTTLSDFREIAPFFNERAQIRRENGQFLMTSGESKQGLIREVVADEVTGFMMRDSMHHRDGQTTFETIWQGWQTSRSGIPFPRLVIRLNFREGIAERAQFLIVHSAEFNISLAPSLFKMGAPAGSVIVDLRMGERSGWSVNYDVIDVTSAEQVKEATRPLPKGLTTPEEKFAVEELKQIYQLADGELIKHIGPPYPLSRKYMPRLRGNSQTPKPGRSRYDILKWQNGAIQDWYTYQGVTPRFSELIFRFLKFDKTLVSADPAILDREVAGDFIYRPDATAEELANRLAAIVSTEFRMPLKLSIREVEWPVYVASGQLKLQLPAGQQRIALNGGPHPDRFPELGGHGDESRFLSDVGSYIGVKVINEVPPTGQQLEWSQRLYDLTSLKPEKRFKPATDVVLRQVTEQTGIAFTRETRKTRVLFVEQGATDAANGAGPSKPVANESKPDQPK
jgi:beta-lactamase regulating signal transducer with metallopeptidase domain